MDKRSRRSAASGYDSLCATFNGAGLALPLIPDLLAAGLREVDRWWWSTLDPDLQPDRRADYMCESEWLESPVPDHATVSHGGHGANSYALTLRMAWGPLALIVQDHWGGIYSDSAIDTGRLAELFANVRKVVGGINSDAHPLPASARPRSLILEASPMRRLFRFRSWSPDQGSWIPVPLPEKDIWNAISERARSAESEPTPSHELEGNDAK